MRISLNWLRELVEFPANITIVEIARKLTLAGLEVEAIDNLSILLKDIIIVRINNISVLFKNENINLYCIYDGKKNIEIVFKSNYLKIGDLVAFVGLNSILPNGVKIIEQKISGILSKGVFISEKDLGLSMKNKNILILNNNKIKPGEKLLKVLNLNDVSMLLSITPNRSDALSQIGIAREIGAIFKTNTKFDITKSFIKEAKNKIKVDVENKINCPRYSCMIIDNINVEESPVWLKSKLLVCGIRPINNIVDITNFIMLKTGQPIHAFDLIKLKKKEKKTYIKVRNAFNGEFLRTIENKKIILVEDDLVIADDIAPIALAGIIGGLNSEVDCKTKTIILESAYFDAKAIRKSAKLHNLTTESSYRFERTVDPNMVLMALNEAAKLVSKICKVKISTKFVDVYSKKITPKIITLSLDYVLEVSGLSKNKLNEQNLCDILLSLGIKNLGCCSEGLLFEIPTFRSDINDSIDLVEEILRIIGYDNIPTNNFNENNNYVSIFNINMENVIKCLSQTFISLGFFEAINFSFGDPDKLNIFSLENKKKTIQIKNPLGKELSVMRQSLLPALINNLILNQRKGNNNIKLFEIGTVFLGLNKNAKLKKTIHNNNLDFWADERIYFAAIMNGYANCQHFMDIRRKLDFFDAKGFMQKALSNLKIPHTLHLDNVKFVKPKNIKKYLNPNLCVDIFVKNLKTDKYKNIGYLGSLHQNIIKKLSINGECFVWELFLQPICDVIKEVNKFENLIKFPLIQRDLSLLIDENLSSSEVTNYIANSKILNSLLSSLNIFDLYEGNEIPYGKKSLSISLILQSKKGTLTDNYVLILINKLINSLKKDLNVTIRK